jgi:hypothetical protein
MTTLILINHKTTFFCRRTRDDAESPIRAFAQAPSTSYAIQSLFNLPLYLLPASVCSFLGQIDQQLKAINVPSDHHWIGCAGSKGVDPDADISKDFEELRNLPGYRPGERVQKGVRTDLGYLNSDTVIG